MMLSRRHFLSQVGSTVLVATATICPYVVQVSNGGFTLSPASAQAQSNGNGNGGGNGNGNAGGNGNGGGNGGGNGNSGGNSKGKGGAKAASPTPAATPSIDAPATADVRHRNGMREIIRKGRYEMRDAKGQTIINRIATPKDYLRFRSVR